MTSIKTTSISASIRPSIRDTSLVGDFGPELVVNGDFAGASLASFSAINGATQAIVSETLEVLNAAATNGGISIDTSLWVSGKTYEIKFDCVTVSGIVGVDLFLNNALDTASVQDAGPQTSTTVWNGVNDPFIRYVGGGQLATDEFSLDDVSVRRVL